MRTLGIVFAAVQLLTLATALRYRYYRFFGLWCMFAAASAWQACSILLSDPLDAAWWRDVWAPAEAVLMALAVAAVAECLWWRTVGMEAVQRFWLRFGLAVMPFSVVFYLARIQHGSWFAEFLQWREYVWIWLALVLFTAMLFFSWRVFRCPLAARSHALIFTVLIYAHAFAAPQVHRGFYAWFDWQAAYRLVGILCGLAWIRNASRLSAGIAAVRHLSARGAGRPPAAPQSVPVAR